MQCLPVSAINCELQRPQIPTACSVKDSFCFRTGFTGQKEPEVLISWVGWEESNSKKVTLRTHDPPPGLLYAPRKLHLQYKDLCLIIGSLISEESIEKLVVPIAQIYLFGFLVTVSSCTLSTGWIVLAASRRR